MFFLLCVFSLSYPSPSHDHLCIAFALTEKAGSEIYLPQQEDKTLVVGENSYCVRALTRLLSMLLPAFVFDMVESCVGNRLLGMHLLEL